MKREKALEAIIALILVCLIIYFRYKLNWILFVALGLVAVTFLSKKITAIIGKGWFLLSQYFGLIMNLIIMFSIYYFVLVPLSFFQRLAGKNQIRKKRNGQSFYYQRDHLFSKSDIKNPW